jgi:ketosteroid isomerase-like protein
MAEITKDEAERELMQLMIQWFGAIKRHDGAWFERMMADDWQYVMIDGSVKDKRWYVQAMQQPFDGEPSTELHELTARVYGNLAIATGHYTIKATSRGTDLSSHTRFTAVWKKHADVWQALAHHATRIAE